MNESEIIDWLLEGDVSIQYQVYRDLLNEEKGIDGGINPAETIPDSDVCVNGMFLSYACYFGAAEVKLHSVIDFILTQRLKDGGFNCLYNQSGAKHSSLHSTLSLLEGLTEYVVNGY